MLDDFEKSGAVPIKNFQDLNFKLAVINHLMYEKEVLKPRFDIYTFVKTIDHPCDIETDGYAVVPEALKWFAALELTPGQLEQVTSLYIEGGSEIYHQIYPFWDGEDDTFDINSFDDVKLLPRLQSIDWNSLVPADIDTAALKSRSIKIGPDIDSRRAASFFREYIADEEAALREGRQGHFYASNWPALESMREMVEDLLGPEERQRLYFHWMRAQGKAWCSKNDFDLLKRAYQEIIPMLDFSYPRNISFQRFIGIYLFGFDDRGALTEGATVDFESFSKFNVILSSFVSWKELPKKKKKFSSFANTPGIAARILQTLRHVNYRHVPYDVDAFSTLNVDFWCLCFIVLLNARTSPQLVGDLRAAQSNLPNSSDRLKHLDFLLSAASKKD